MNIQSTRAQQTQKKNWFYDKERKPNVIGASPADNVRDIVSFSAMTGLVAGGAALAISSMGVSTLAATALAIPATVLGAGVGMLGSIAVQTGIGAAIGAPADGDAGMGAGMAGLMFGSVSAGAGALAAACGADPMTVALTAAGVGGGMMLLAGFAD